MLVEIKNIPHFSFLEVWLSYFRTSGITLTAVSEMLYTQRERFLMKCFFDSVSLSYLSKDHHHLVPGAPGLEELAPGTRSSYRRAVTDREKKCESLQVRTSLDTMPR